MKQYYIILTVLLLLAVSACDDESAAEKSYKGKLIVTVNTSDIVWGYPQVGNTLSDTGASLLDGTWMYPEVGGNDDTPCVNDEIDDKDEDLADEPIPSGDIGNRINYVYLYGSLITAEYPNPAANTHPVLYKGSSSDNQGAITISNIAPGDYYVAAFYDYNKGGKITNMLNRYDRYSLYDGTPAGPGTPYADLAATVTVNEDTVEITLDIDEDWVLGKPNTGDGGTGRLFLFQSDGIPVQEVACD